MQGLWKLRFEGGAKWDGKNRNGVKEKEIGSALNEKEKKEEVKDMCREPNRILWRVWKMEEGYIRGRRKNMKQEFMKKIKNRKKILKTNYLSLE